MKAINIILFFVLITSVLARFNSYYPEMRGINTNHAYRPSYAPQVNGFVSGLRNPVGSISYTQPVYQSPKVDAYIHTSHSGPLNKMRTNQVLGEVAFKF